MKLNADFSRRVAVHSEQLGWVTSPIAGVERRMLDRVGDEVARATSIVRYAAGSQFAAHTHGGGEEFLVLDGVFQDEHGDFPAGAYIRNPPGTSHTPRSALGCTIFVKLRQFDPDDSTQVRLNTMAMPYRADQERQGVEVLQLHKHTCEDVRLERWAPNVTVELRLPEGMEALCLDGSFAEGGDTFALHSWLRLPKDSLLNAKAGATGCRLWIKTGHLASPTYQMVPFGVGR